MAHEASKPQLTLDEYLEGERSSPIKHEYAAGRVFAMAGASERHNKIAGNLFAHLHLTTRSSDCVAFISDMRVRIDQVVYYPDLMVCCDRGDNDPYLKHSPCLVIEVLSESTERIDRGEKLHNYRQIASLQACVLVAQDTLRVEIYRRTSGPHWQYESYSAADDRIELPCPPSTLTLAEIYERIEFLPGN
jgi:Uma2 family endonuclease